MTAFMIGDKVEITGPPCGIGVEFGLGTIGTVTQFCGEDYKVAQNEDWWIYPASSLRPAPAFKAGDRVLVKHTGKEEPILRVWHSEGVADVYELEDEFCDADELEPASEPKREPKAGEVWQVDRGSLLLIGKDDGIFNLTRMTAYTVPWETTESLTREGVLTFAAASLKDAAALGLL